MQFVRSDSIVRTIWGRRDTILFIFGGAAAEFALNKAVDWLYFTGRLPAEPIGRLFSTVTYARKIVFSSEDVSNKVIDNMRAIHQQVETNRQANIPEWAYRDVLFMLIHYSIASFEVLERKLTAAEKEEVFNVFYRVGARMGLKDLPISYHEWLKMREEHLNENLHRSKYTDDLFRQYKKHLGRFRYFILREAQKLVVPRQVKKQLNFGDAFLFRIVVGVFKFSRKLKIDWLLVSTILPKKYKEEIRNLEVSD